jgi:hypothetical protein
MITLLTLTDAEGKPILVSAEHLIHIYAVARGSALYFNNGMTLNVQESFDDIKAQLGAGAAKPAARARKA